MRRGLLCVAIALLGVAQAADVPVCPRGLETVLESPACRVHRLHIVSVSRTVIATSTSNDLCVDALRFLLVTDPPAPPCATDLRRSIATDARDLHCAFDARDVDHQGLIVDCREIPTRHKRTTWHWLAVGLVGVLVISGVFIAGPRWQRIKIHDWQRQWTSDKSAMLASKSHAFALA